MGNMVIVDQERDRNTQIEQLSHVPWRAWRTSSGERHLLRLPDRAVSRHEGDAVYHACRRDDFVRRVTTEVERPDPAGGLESDRPCVDAWQSPHHVHLVAVGG